MKKKLLSILLCLCMGLTLLPAVALAADISGAITAESGLKEWKDGDIIPSTGVTIAGSNNPDAPVVVSVNGTVTVNGEIVITGQVRLTGSGRLLRGNGFRGNLIALSGGNLTMDGVTIHGNNLSGVSSAVLVSSGSFTMNGGSIVGNTAAGNGGGVYVNPLGTFTMNGGAITGNTATGDGGGVYVSGAMKVSASAYIMGNSGGTEGGKAAGNVYLCSGKTMTVTGALTGAIGVSAESAAYPVDIAEGGDEYATLTDADADHVFPDKLIDTDGTSGYSIKLDNGMLKLFKTEDIVKTVRSNGNPSGTGGVFDTLANALTQLKTTPGGWIIDVQESQVIHSALPIISQPVTITSTVPGTKLIRGSEFSGNGSELLHNRAAVTISNLTIDGNSIADTNAAVYVDGLDARLIMNDCSIINNKGSKEADGGGVFILNGSFTMNGGSISGNTVGYKGNGGGGVHVANSGSFTMNDGSITGNTSYDNTSGWGSGKGGGVLVSNTGGSFTMNGGVITGNTATSGGGVYACGDVRYGGGMTVSGGARITGNNGGGAASNLYLLSNNQTITVADYFKGSVGVTCGATVTDPVAITGNNSADYSENFFSDNDDYAIKNSGAGTTQVLQISQKPQTAALSLGGNPASAARADAAAKSVVFTLGAEPEAGTYKVYKYDGEKEYKLTADVTASVSGTTLTLAGASNGVIPLGNYQITLTAEGKRESEPLSLTVKKATKVVFYPNGTKTINQVNATVNGSSYTAEAGENCTVTVDINGTPALSGTHEIKIAGNDVEEIKEQTFEVDKGTAIAANTQKTFSFTMPQKNVTLTMTHTFTAKNNITSVTGPTAQTLTEYCDDTDAVIAELPPTVTVTGKSGTTDITSLPCTWALKAGEYNTAPGESNTFVWSVDAATTNSTATTGDVTITNKAQTEISSLAFGSAITPVNGAAPATKEALNGASVLPEGVTCTSISWAATVDGSVVNGNFAAGTQYQATLKLSADYPNYKLVSALQGSGAITAGELSRFSVSVIAPEGLNPVNTATVTLFFNATAASAVGPSDRYHTITATAGKNGTISPSGSASVREGLDAAYTITSDKGYQIADVLVDGVSVGAVKTYIFTNVSREHTISATFREATWDNPFKDVKESDWFYGDVAYVAAKSLVSGSSATTFAPHANTNRGMIVTILYRLEGEPAVTGTNPFDDVPGGRYYEKAILWAAGNKIVEGYGNGKFGPDDDITREQLAAILYRYAQYKGYDVSVGENTNLLSYHDALTVSEYAIPAMQWACGAGLIQGDNGNLMPRGNAERCQAAAILHRFVENVAK